MKKALPILMAFALLAACSRQEARQKTTDAVDKVTNKVQNLVDEVSAPVGKPENPADRERERFDAQWRQLQSFRAQQAAQAAQAAQQAQQAQAAAAPPSNFVFVANKKKETFKGLDANAINNAPINVPITGDVRGPSVLRAQVYLDWLHFSVGSIDGRWGRNSAITVWWYQHARGLEATGDVDEQTFRKIAAEAGYPPVLTQYTLTPDDVKGPFHSIPDDVYEQAKLSALGYESLREKLSEQFHCTEDFLELLNPDVKFSDLQSGRAINVPNVRPPMTADGHDITRLVISISGNSFSGFDANSRLVFHAPTTVGAGYDPSPSENLRIVKIVPDPHFHYDPTLYHEVPDTEPDAHLPPGPNSPVGVVWIALSKEHYGIHGTKDPDSIGYASSHGCVRLTNWDAAEIEHRVNEGVQVSFVDTRSKGLPDVARKD
jgi:lipoprotein-anchoring transpeptidase ErfK/SrfK